MTCISSSILIIIWLRKITVNLNELYKQWVSIVTFLHKM